MRTLLALAAGLLSATLFPAPAQAVDETTIGFGLPRGAAVVVPHVEGTTLVDGDLRIPLDADYAFYVGRSGPSYVVETGHSDGSHNRIVLVGRDGTATRLARAYDFLPGLSDDGQRMVTTRLRRDRTSTLTVRSASTGAPLAQRTFRGDLAGLDVDGDRVLLGGSRRTLLWRTGPDTLEVVSRDQGYRGDLGSDVVAVFDRSTRTDEGACTRILRVSTRRLLTTLCDDLVLAFNADASRMVTTSRYLDGPISVVRARTVAGRVLGQYRSTRSLAVGETRWETTKRLLITLDGPHRSGTVRCSGTTCVLAGGPVRSS